MIRSGSASAISLILESSSSDSDTTLGTISRLSERARYARPAFVTLADRIASYIVVALLVIAAAVAGWDYEANNLDTKKWVDEAVKHGVIDVLQKPLDLDRMTDVVQTALS